MGFFFCACCGNGDDGGNGPHTDYVSISEGSSASVNNKGRSSARKRDGNRGGRNQGSHGFASGDEHTRTSSAGSRRAMSSHVGIGALKSSSGKLDVRKTLRPKKRHRKGTRRYMLHQRIKATLGKAKGISDWAHIVKLPDNESLDEWIAVHTIDFYNEISLLYGTISDVCTPFSCPCMSAGTRFTYLWADGVTVKKPIKVPAADYVNYLMEWVDNQLSNEDIFPVAAGKEFPSDFQKSARVIFKRLFRVYAHMYHSHFNEFAALRCEAHLNTCFKRFTFFILEFGMVGAKELAPLKELIQTITAKPAKVGATM